MNEPLDGQPVFAIRATSIVGIGDFSSPTYEVRIRISIHNTGASYLEPHGVGLVTIDGGVYKVPKNAEVEFKGGEDRLAIEREHLIKVRRGADLLSCSLHVRYVDNVGKERTQEFRVLLEGSSGPLPSNVFFPLIRVSTLVLGTPWLLR